MSRGQKPRWPAYFPHMKDRGRHRRRGVRIVLYDGRGEPIWPPVLLLDGQSLPIRIDKGATIRVTGRAIGTRTLDRRTGMWIEGE
ncbi:hypothetical protein [Nocardia africana]|uniref:Uncharacterized protein n=1 Tax=Nocardia africana TaxID=134964 RepID=A0A378X2I5_9NOCA|nr:hypothetical protein [Nocardia africana]MCC3311500.1 hypothetical protein [Nocardia africana]SUA47237.1 Uncharacterised protein [Nocardia africana]